MSVSVAQNRLSRRALVGSSLAGAAVIGLSPGRSASAAATPSHASGVTLLSQSAPSTSPSAWRTWLLESPDELRPDKPGTPSADEIEDLIGFQAEPTDEMAAAIAKWGRGSAMAPWSTVASELFTEFSVGGPLQNRNYALLQTAMHDAVIAAWDAQVTHERPSPAATDDRITPPAGVDPAQSSFPSTHAAVAAAAATVLTYLLPDAEAGRFDALAQEAAMSRLWAGAAFRSDMEAGLRLGAAVGEKAVARGKGDNFAAKFDLAGMPKGPGFWQPTPPAFADPAVPLAGASKPWVLESGDQFRPQAPPKYGSDAWKAELDTVQATAASRTFQQASLARYWAQIGPFASFTGFANELIARNGLDNPHAARVLAAASVAAADAITAVWDAKYTWWTSRPITEDPELETLFPTPPYPSYPGGFSGAVGAHAAVLGSFFPEAADELAARAWEGANSRCWAGIHYVIDDDVALSMGRQIGGLVASLVRADIAGGAV